MKKRSVSLFLATIMLLSVVGVVSVSAQTSATTSLDPNAANGYTYTASTSGIYRITYLNGAYNPWPPNSGPGNTWRNSIYIYLNRPISGVEVGACDYQLGAISGYYSTPTQAEAAAQGTYVDIPMKAGDYIILLIPDDQGAYGDNQGGITVSIELAAPTAPTAVIETSTPPLVVGGAITLDGSKSSDPQGKTLTYAWTVTSPDGNLVGTSSPSTAVTTFTPDLPGTYVAQLTVSNGELSSSVTTDVTVKPKIEITLKINQVDAEEGRARKDVFLLAWTVKNNGAEPIFVSPYATITGQDSDHNSVVFGQWDGHKTRVDGKGEEETIRVIVWSVPSERNRQCGGVQAISWNAEINYKDNKYSPGDATVDVRYLQVFMCSKK